MDLGDTRWLIALGLLLLGYLAAVTQNVIASWLTGSIAPNAPLFWPVRWLRKRLTLYNRVLALYRVIQLRSDIVRLKELTDNTYKLITFAIQNTLRFLYRLFLIMVFSSFVLLIIFSEPGRAPAIWEFLSIYGGVPFFILLLLIPFVLSWIAKPLVEINETIERLRYPDLPSYYIIKELAEIYHGWSTDKDSVELISEIDEIYRQFPEYQDGRGGLFIGPVSTKSPENK